MFTIIILVHLQGCRAWRYCDRGRVPPSVQDSAIQRAEGDEGVWSQEALQEVLNSFHEDVKLMQNKTFNLNPDVCFVNPRGVPTQFSLNDFQDSPVDLFRGFLS